MQKPATQPVWRQLPHRQTWNLAWPLIVANLSTPLMGLADTAMLGHLEDAVFLGAVALGANLVAMLYWLFSFLRMGTTGFTGRAHGAGNDREVMAQLSQNSCLGVLLGIGLIAVHPWILAPTLGLMTDQKTLFSLALHYGEIRIYSAPLVLLTYVFTGWLVALGHTKLALAMVVSANLLNILLDYIFIVQLGWNVTGAALATLIAEGSGCVVGLVSILWLCKKKSWPLAFKFDPRVWLAQFSVNRDLFIRTASILFAINFFNAQSAGFGEATLAANAILFQCSLFAAFFLDGYALAAESMTAKALGRNKLRDFHRATLVTSIWSLGIAFALAIAFWVFGIYIRTALTSLIEVREIAEHHWPWLVSLPLLSVLAYTFDGVMVGAGRAKVMRNIMLLALFVFLATWWLTPNWGNHGLWLAFILFNITRSISLLMSYAWLTYRGYWLNLSK